MPRVGASRARTLAVPCVLTPQLPPFAIPHLTPDTLSIFSLLACHPLPTRLSSLSLCTFHPFVVTTLALSNSSHVFFHGVRETGLFTHGSDTLSSKIISMCTPDVAMPCLCYAWLGCAMPLRHRTIGSSRARTLVVPCVLTPQLPPCAIAHLTPTHFPSSPYSLSITLPLHFPSLCRLHTGTSPILSTFLSMTCELKRFPLTSPRKLALMCVKRGFLRTAEPH